MSTSSPSYEPRNLVTNRGNLVKNRGNLVTNRDRAVICTIWDSFMVPVDSKITEDSGHGYLYLFNRADIDRRAVSPDALIVDTGCL